MTFSLADVRPLLGPLGAFVAKYAGTEPKMMRALPNRVFKYARAKRARKLYKEHGLDAFVAVQPLGALGSDFVEKNYPQMKQTSFLAVKHPRGERRRISASALRIEVIHRAIAAKSAVRSLR